MVREETIISPDRTTFNKTPSIPTQKADSIAVSVRDCSHRTPHPLNNTGRHLKLVQFRLCRSKKTVRSLLVLRSKHPRALLVLRSGSRTCPKDFRVRSSDGLQQSAGFIGRVDNHESDGQDRNQDQIVSVAMFSGRGSTHLPNAINSEADDTPQALLWTVEITIGMNFLSGEGSNGPSIFY